MMQPNFIYSAVCNRVIDGDTINVTIDLGFELDLRNRNIRLDGFNAPEMNDPDPVMRAKAQAVKDFMINAVQGKPIVIRTIKTRSGAERMTLGRYVAEVWYMVPDENGMMRQVFLNDQAKGVVEALMKPLAPTT